MKSASVAFVLSAISAFGAGFSLYEGSATGVANYPLSVAHGGRAGDQYFNAATLSATTGTVVQAGAFVVKPRMSIIGRNPYTGEQNHQPAKKEWWTIPHAYLAHQVKDDLWFGAGLFSRAGLGGDFGKDWYGRYNSSRVEILTYDFNANLAYKPCDWLTVSAGFTILYFDIDIRQSIDVAGAQGLRRYNDPDPSPFDVRQRLAGDDWAYGYDFGLQLKPFEGFAFGLAYHSEVEVEARGDATYEVPAVIRAACPGYFHTAKMSGEVDLPAAWMLGATYDVTDRLTLGIGAVYTEWSSWDELCISIHEPMVIPGRDELRSKKNWNDVWRYTAGASFKLLDCLTAHASYTWDESPINRDYADYLIPADDRHMWCFGLSWENGPWTLDATYFIEHIHRLNVTGRPLDGFNSGAFVSGSARAIAFSLSRAF